MILAALINVLAIVFNIWMGFTFGFTGVTYVCIGLNAGVAAWCFMQASIRGF